MQLRYLLGQIELKEMTWFTSIKDCWAYCRQSGDREMTEK